MSDLRGDVFEEICNLEQQHRTIISYGIVISHGTIKIFDSGLGLD